jgi:hypothetical protein
VSAARRASGCVARRSVFERADASAVWKERRWRIVDAVDLGKRTDPFYEGSDAARNGGGAGTDAVAYGDDACGNVDARAKDGNAGVHVGVRIETGLRIHLVLLS